MPALLPRFFADFDRLFNDSTKGKDLHVHDISKSLIVVSLKLLHLMYCTTMLGDIAAIGRNARHVDLQSRLCLRAPKRSQLSLDSVSGSSDNNAARTTLHTRIDYA